MAEYIEITSRLGKGKYDNNSITETAYPVMLINMDDPVFGGRLKINEILVNWWFVTRLNLCWIHYLLLPAVLQRIQWALLVSNLTPVVSQSSAKQLLNTSYEHYNPVAFLYSKMNGWSYPKLLDHTVLILIEHPTPCYIPSSAIYTIWRLSRLFWYPLYKHNLCPYKHSICSMHSDKPV